LFDSFDFIVHGRGEVVKAKYGICRNFVRLSIVWAGENACGGQSAFAHYWKFFYFPSLSGAEGLLRDGAGAFLTE